MSWQLSRYTGLFRDHAPTPRRAHDPDVFVYAGDIANRPPGARADAAGGAAWTAEAAELAAAGEAIERWQTHLLPCDRTRRARHADFAGDAIAPSSFPLFHADQYARAGFPFEPLADSLELEWLAFRRVADGERRWVPAELAAMDLRPGARHRFAPAISTGWSAHTSLPTAILRGMQELVERDALMRAWWGQCPVEQHPLADVLGDRAARVVRANLEIRGYRIATPHSDHVTMVTIAGEDREGFCFSIGSACRETRAASWDKALLEAIQGRSYVRYLRTALGARDYTSPRDFAEHAVAYSFHPDRLARTCLETVSATISAAPEKVSDTISGMLGRLGPERAPLFRVMTPPAFSSPPRGWCVVRVMMPNMQPMHGDHALPFLGGPAWGDRAVADHANLPPHPFA